MISEAVRQEILHSLGIDAGPASVRFEPIGGGSINACYKVDWKKGTAFCKVNSATKFPHLFGQEAKGLQALGAGGAIRVPEVIGHFEKENTQVLLLQYIPPGPRTEKFWKDFGAALAALHGNTATHFGWEENNYMGSVPQQNTKSKDWTSFFIACRLQPLVQQCEEKGLLHSTDHAAFEQLYERLDTIFEKEPRPALLHGDLWSGNFLCDAGAAPVLIDPAVYYGHPSVDLAMTTLFGGFQQPFYEAYDYHAKLPSNYREQWQVCNLYPLLIHLLLFGSGYLSPIRQTLSLFR